MKSNKINISFVKHFRLIVLLIASFISINVIAQNEYNPYFVPFDEENWTLLKYDKVTGNAVLTFKNEKPQFISDSTITTLVNDTIGYFLRKITTVSEVGKTLNLKTQAAALEDVFINKSFTLSTSSGTTNNSQLKSAIQHSTSEIIYPSEIILQYQDTTTNQLGVNKIKLTNENMLKSAKAVNRPLHYEKTYGNIEIYKKDNLQILAESIIAKLDADALIYFEFKPKGGNLSLKSSIQTLDFKVLGNTTETIKFKLEAEAEYSKGEDDEIMIAENVLKTTLKFMVGFVPIWVTFSGDLAANATFNGKAKLEATWGLTAKQDFTVGGNYKSSTSQFDSYAEIVPTIEYDPLEVTGEANAEARLEIFPRINMVIYSIVGPYCEIVPYISADYNAKAMVSTSGKSNVKWNSSLNTGIDVRSGVKPKVFESILGEIGPSEDNWINKELWSAPSQIELKTKLVNSYIVPVLIPVGLKITDSHGNGCPFAPVFLKANSGKIDDEWLITDSKGNINVNWSLDYDNSNASSGNQSFEAKLLSTEDSLIASKTIKVNANTKPTAIVIKDLTGGDITFNNMAFKNIDNALLTSSDNNSSLNISNSQFIDCENSIKGSLKSLKINENTSFTNCQSGINLLAKNGTNSAVEIENTTFNNISATALNTNSVTSITIKSTTFETCTNAVIASAQYNRPQLGVSNSKFNNCASGIDARNIRFLSISNCSIYTEQDNSSDNSNTAIWSESVNQSFIQDCEINGYYLGIYLNKAKYNSYIRNNKLLNVVNGIEFLEINNSKVTSNSIKSSKTSGNNGVGLLLRNANYNTIGLNNISAFCTGKKEMDCEKNHYSENKISLSTCTNTGFHSISSTPEIVNNTFEDNNGAALNFSGLANPTIANNNFIGNMVGISNNSLQTITASNNFYTDQFAQNISGNVFDTKPRKSQVGLVCDFPADTIFISSGNSDTINLLVQNFVDLHDSVQVTFSDVRNWLNNNLQQNSKLQDSTGTIFNTLLNIESEEEGLKSIRQETSNVVYGNVKSFYTNEEAIDSIVVAIYNQELNRIDISPEYATIQPGDSIQISYLCYDQHNWEMDTELLFSSTAGKIDSNGWLHTDSTSSGEIEIVLTHPNSTLTATAYVMVNEVLPRLSTIEIESGDTVINSGNIAAFKAVGFDQFGYPIEFDANWECSSGSITNNGTFTAPNSPGTVDVVVSNDDFTISQAIQVTINCVQNSYQEIILCEGDSILIHEEWIKSGTIITDTIETMNNCIEVQTKFITFEQAPEVSFELTTTEINTNDPAFELTGGQPEGGTYLIDNTEILSFDPALYSAGSYPLEYTYTNSSGCSNSAFATINVINNTGINSFGIEKSLVYPNPNSGSFSIRLPTNNSVKITVRSISGQFIWEGNFHSREIAIQLQNLTPGIYLLEINDLKTCAIKKLTIE